METGFLADIIKEVLVRGDVACLPGLGAFIAEQVPAYFSDKGFTINPPYLKPVFDERVKDDMTLVDFYAENNGLSRSRAQDIVLQEVAAVRKELATERIVLLPGLGYFRMPHDGRIIFIVEEGLQIFPHCDLLEPVSLRHLDAAVFMAKKMEVDRTEPLPEQKPQDVPASEPEQASGAGRKILVTALIMVSVALIALAALAILGRLCPEIVDRILYSAEELEILNAGI